MDNHSKEIRSYNMSKIRNKNTKPEVLVRKFLFSAGFRYRKNDQRLPGHPDIVLPKYKTIIFVNGCFWHGHNGCRYFVFPKSNSGYWKHKITSNIERDAHIHILLQELGWNIIIVWECELRNNMRERIFSSLIDNIKINYKSVKPPPPAV